MWLWHLSVGRPRRRLRDEPRRPARSQPRLCTRRDGSLTRSSTICWRAWMALTSRSTACVGSGWVVSHLALHHIAPRSQTKRFRAETRPRGFISHRATGRRTLQTGMVAQCAVFHRLPQAHPLAAFSRSLSCRECFLNGGWQFCVGSRAPEVAVPPFVDVPGETVTLPAVCLGCTAFLADGHRLPMWELTLSRKLLSFRAWSSRGSLPRRGSPRSLPRGCRKRVNELVQHQVRLVHLPETAGRLQGIDAPGTA